MLNFILPDNELERLKKLEFFDLLNLGKDPQFDVFAETACLIADCPASLISIMESEMQTVQSCVGLEIDSVARRNTICQYSIASGEIVIINDTLLDERTRLNPLVIEGGIRFYVGVPFFDDEGFALGTICVIDYKPRAITDSQITALKKLSDVISKLFTAKRKTIYAEYFQQIFNISNNLICVLDHELKFKDFNPVVEKIFSLRKEEAIGHSFTEVFGESNKDLSKLKDLMKGSREVSFTTSKDIEEGGSVIVEWAFKPNQEFSEIFCFGTNITQETEEKRQLES